MYNYFEFEGAVRANSGVSLPTQHLAFDAQNDFRPKVIRVCSGTGTLGGTFGQGGNGRRVRILCSDGLVHRFNVAMGYGQEFVEARAQVCFFAQHCSDLLCYIKSCCAQFSSLRYDSS